MSNTATATLVRGRSYTYKDVQFMKDEPKTVSEELGQELENLGDDVLDSDGEQVIKPRFKVTFNHVKSGAPKKINTVKTLGKSSLQTSAKPLGAGGIKKRKV